MKYSMKFIKDQLRDYRGTVDMDAVVLEVANKFIERTNNPKSVYDLSEEYRVTWTEILEIMKQHGFKDDPMTARFLWESKRTKFNKLIR